MRFVTNAPENSGTRFGAATIRERLAALGLRASVKRPCHPAHPERLPASRPRQESTLCPAPPQGAVWRQVSSSHNKERTHDLNPLTSANSPDLCHRPRRRTFVLVHEAGLVRPEGEYVKTILNRDRHNWLLTPIPPHRPGSFTPPTALCADATTEQPAAAMRRNFTRCQTGSDEAGRIGTQTSRSRKVHARLQVCIRPTLGRRIGWIESFSKR